MRALFHKIGSIGLFFFVYCIARYLMFRGRLRVAGWDNLLQLVEACDGKCIIVSNHPTLWEPIFIKVLLWKWYRKDFNRHPKNVTAVDELHTYPILTQILFRYAGLIPVDRNDESTNASLFLAMARAVRKQCPVIICPEGRCTATPAAREKDSDETYPSTPALGEPYMLMPRGGVLKFATQQRVPLITACVTLGSRPWLMSTSHWQELKRISACGMTIEFSDSLFYTDETTTVEALAHRIMHP